MDSKTPDFNNLNIYLGISSVSFCILTHFVVVLLLQKQNATHSSPKVKLISHKGMQLCLQQNAPTPYLVAFEL